MECEALAASQAVDDAIENCVADCEPLREVLARLSDKWTVALFAALGNKRMRFKELDRAIVGVSERMLIVTLKNLERDGFVNRIVHPTVPPKVEYELTLSGRSLRSLLIPVSDWVKANWSSVEEARLTFGRKN